MYAEFQFFYCSVITFQFFPKFVLIHYVELYFFENFENFFKTKYVQNFIIEISTDLYRSPNE